MSSDVDTLMEMGFSRNKAQRALAKTNYKGVQLAMDWLFAHDGDADIDEPFEAPKGNVLGKTEDLPAPPTTAGGEGPDAPGEENMQARSLKCDECGKLLRSEMDAQAHAARTQHASFSESTEEIKPLTDEEKKQKLQDLQDRLKQRRMAKDEEEKKEQIAREKARRTTNKELGMAKQKIEEEEIKKIAEHRRREKMEERQARERVREQIAKDKADRAAKFGKTSQHSPPSAACPPASTQTTGAAAAPKEYDTCRLQIRLTNGQVLTQSFKAKEPLAAVRLYIEMNRSDGTGPFSLLTSFPRKVFSSEDMEKPLDTLGLVPSAVLIVSKPQ
ncbi:UBX domain-containing protein 1-like [Haliotis rufescens]|uniref:UBX domain-containing protein 1-like n=1 Tax=Haliotis rufescens TaxID=6454 RepID=UPI001EAF92E2|nr:UBX domain-containing protein 1-like [Haliotis rufescens]